MGAVSTIGAVVAPVSTAPASLDMPDALLPRGALARLAIVAAIALFFAVPLLVERAQVMEGEAPMTIAAIVWLLCLAGFLCCAEGAKVIG